MTDSLCLLKSEENLVINVAVHQRDRGESNKKGRGRMIDQELTTVSSIPEWVDDRMEKCFIGLPFWEVSPVGDVDDRSPLLGM